MFGTRLMSLDARGVISVTERVGYIERVRRLAQRTARAYAAQREEMGASTVGALETQGRGRCG